MFDDMAITSISPVDTFFFPYFTLTYEEFMYSLALPVRPNPPDELTLYSMNYANPVLAYHYSIPVTKLAYPEPFIASASLMHSDLWFVHILIYQYWLWFVFVYLIIFFFVTFVFTVRWCNMRVQPRRETRGVSRSKCGDLITACVPVSWATSIIVHESTDAIDYYDGFGTSEMVVGIRAYQWGWEYYYPRDLDLNYNQRPSYSAFIGKSLKYESATALKGERAFHWKHFLVHLNQQPGNNPSLLWLNADRFNLIPKLIGQTPLRTPLRNTSAFAEARRISKVTPYEIFSPSNSSTKWVVSPHLTRLAPFAHSMGFMNTIVPPFTLLAPQNNLYDLTSSIETAFRGVQTTSVLPLKHLTFLNAQAITNSSNLPSTISTYQADEFNPMTETSSLLGTERVSRTILNFNSTNANWNQIGPRPCTAEGGLSSMNCILPPLLNQSHHVTSNAAPLISSNPLVNVKTMDEVSSVNASGTPTILLNKEELLPEWSIVSHWANTQLNTSPLWYDHFYSIRQKLLLHSPLVPFIPYNEYDFLNWQAYDLLETAVWDLSGVNQQFEETVLTLDTFFDEYLKLPYTRPFATLGRDHWTKKVFTSFVGARGDQYPEYRFVPMTAATLGFNFTPSIALTSLAATLECATLESSYESVHSFVNMRNSGTFKRLGLASSLALTRPQLESAFTFSSAFSPLTFWLSTRFENLNDDVNNPVELTLTSSINTPVYQDLIRLDQVINVRLPIKNVNVTAQAMQKVFKTRFDELRSFVRGNDFSLVENRLPLISSKIPTLRGALTKNGTVFNATPIHHLQLASTLPNAMSNLSLYTSFELPVMLGLKSDSGRHIWIDWFARWGFYEVQPSSTARYAIYGMPYFAKLFDFNAGINDEISETENYFVRLARARRLYQPNFITAPFAMASNNTLFLHNTLGNSDANFDNLEGFQEILAISYKYFASKQCVAGRVKSFAPATSSSNTYSRSSWQPHTHSDVYNLYATNLLDTLTRREYLLRILSLRRNSTVTLSTSTIASPSNPLFILWEQNFKTPTHQSLTSFANLPVFPTLITRWLEQSSSKTTLIHWGNMKNQYRPMRKGINNLLRLHATNAIALPCEIRLQILASSKDVIHSWAVPSAGIKIDCVPGYSSHKIMMFLLSGIFWGQCMEICGRYHHWMPIVVYFMKRDMFVLWCTHFVFYDKNTQTLRNLTDSIHSTPRPVSFPITSWRNE